MTELITDEIVEAAARAMCRVRHGSEICFGHEWADLLDEARAVLTAALPMLVRAERPVLWCCHIRGPDDVIPTPDYETAVRVCDATNTLTRESAKRAGIAAEEIWYDAIPALWPWSVEDHAAGLTGKNNYESYLPATAIRSRGEPV